MPLVAPSFVDPSGEAPLQSENGILGLGPYPQQGEEDPGLINAGRETVTLKSGAAVFETRGIFRYDSSWAHEEREYGDDPEALRFPQNREDEGRALKALMDGLIKDEA